jgi:hypothetical protein
VAGGIDWFRWHHGSVNDQKFGLIAKRAGASVAEVVAMWAFILESASSSADRGHPGELDFEAIDFALGLADGKASSIHARMQERQLINQEGRIIAWDRRQPKREDNSAAERKRRQRERETAGHCVTGGDVTQCHDREEERREELTSKPTTPDGVVVGSDAANLPASGPAKPDCPHQQIIALYHEVLPMCPKVRDWTPARATQLRARWNEDEKRQSIDWWRQFFGYVKRCDFLVGRGTSASNRPFFADLEWLTKSANFTKVREGKYEQ